eukprot:574977-Karenia_brevis.AAC.1
MPCPFLADGALACPLCPNTRVATAPALLRHFTMQHTGEALDANAAALLRTLERGVCTGPECGGLRRIGVRHYYRCGHATAVRPPRAGDVLVGA